MEELNSKIYIPTEAEVAAISGYDPGDQLVEYYSAAERLRLGYLATTDEKYNEIVTGPMQYADSERLYELGAQVLELLNENFENEWNGACFNIYTREDRRLITRSRVAPYTNEVEAPYPQKEYVVMSGQFKFFGESYGEFNNYHKPDKYTVQQLNPLKFYEDHTGTDYILHAPVVKEHSGEPLITMQFVPRPKSW